jgi:Ca2+-transporting ATPase
VTDADRVVTGDALDAWGDEELKKRIVDIDIYARVEPRHKIRIVNAWQARGEVVAMTGDGVNDAPALKAADIGVALGSGTEVAKQASDIILLDNNLSTITAAIEQGRIIFDNIRKSSLYLLVSSFTELVLIGGALIFRLPIPLIPVQILWINLIEDTLPSIALTMEPGEPGVMERKPRPRKEPVLNREMLFYIFFIGLMTDIVLFLLYIWFLKTTGDVVKARTVVFTAVSIDSLLYVFAIRNFRRSIFRTNPFSNPWLLGAVGIGFALVAVSRLTPFFQGVFEIVHLTLPEWGLLLMMGMMKLVFIEISKEVFILRERAQTKRNS